jgi:hypothetical protein
MTVKGKSTMTSKQNLVSIDAEHNETVATSSIATALLGAALLLVGVEKAHAQSIPIEASLNVKYLNYEEKQQGLKRISVKSPSLQLILPIAGEWLFDGSLTSDDVSGASPRYHTAISGASKMSDYRKAADLSLTRYFEDSSLTFGSSYSGEHDYDSLAFSITGTFSTPDKNRTWSFGIGGSNDTINPTNKIVRDEHKKSKNILVGVSQVVTPVDLVQITFSHGRSEGYFSDPYKLLDERPRHRNQSSMLARWNHYLPESGATARLAYRYYRDSFSIKAHTFQAELEKELGNGWSVTPLLRVYSQSAATFYFDPIYDTQIGEPFPQGYQFGVKQFSSADQRLSGFGALTFGVGISKKLQNQWTIDFRAERYEQRTQWRLFHRGSVGLLPLSASILQIGLGKQW